MGLCQAILYENTLGTAVERGVVCWKIEMKKLPRMETRKIQRLKI